MTIFFRKLILLLSAVLVFETPWAQVLKTPQGTNLNNPLVTVNPGELIDSLGKNQTSTQVLTLTNVSNATVNFSITPDQVTTMGVVPSPSCWDGIQNQGETAVDCGGPCPSCGGSGVSATAVNFDSDMNNWTDGAGSHLWLVTSRPTDTNNTGPSGASQGSFYAYMETSALSANSPGDNVQLVSPLINSSGSLKMTFDYHMFGSDIGTLYVDVKAAAGSWQENIWSASGNQGDKWLSAVIDLSSFSGDIQVRLRAVAAGGQEGDIAIDDVKIKPDALLPKYATDFESLDLGYLNGQEGWSGSDQWLVHNIAPSEGTRHIRCTSNGSGNESTIRTADFTAGIEDISSMSAMINIEGTGTSWELVTANDGFFNIGPALRFNADRSIDAWNLWSYVPTGVSVPTGYFKLEIELDRLTKKYSVWIDNENVFSGISAGSGYIYMQLKSSMTTSASAFSMDQLQFLDGPIDRPDPFVSTGIQSGTLNAGESVDIQVTFDAGQLDFGTYTSNLVIGLNAGNNESVIVPTTLTVTGSPAMFIESTQIQETLNFNQLKTRVLNIQNMGGAPLNIDLSVSGTSTAWLAFDQTSYTIPVGETTGIKLSLDATKVDPGTYTADLLIEGNATKAPVTIPIAIQELNSAQFSFSPGSLQQELTSGSSASQDITISNTGESDLFFNVEDNFRNVTQPQGTSNGDGSEFSTVVYSSNYETFSAGDLNSQQGWVSDPGDWLVASSNPGGNNQHVHVVSDGSGQSQAVSPQVAPGTSTISSTSMLVNFRGIGSTWQITPRTPTEQLDVTTLKFNPDGSLSVLVADNGGEYRIISWPTPESYFELKIEVNRSTKEMVIYFDGTEVFTGTGFAGSIEQVAFAGLMETQGAVMDIDNFQIVDGIIPALSLSASPKSGSVASGETLNVQVTFDATNLTGGIYEENLVINTTDVSHSQVIIPTALRVINPPTASVNVNELTEILGTGQASTQVFSISNSGDADLNFTIGSDAGLTGAVTYMDGIKQPAVNRESTNSSDLSLVLLSEGFEGASFPPDGWTVVDNANTGGDVLWKFAKDHFESNYTGSGEAATVNSEYGVAYDTELITPVIDVTGKTGIVLEYLVNYQWFGEDIFDLDITTDGGTTWTNILSWKEQHGTLYQGPGEFVSIRLDGYIRDANAFQVRWRYYNPDTYAEDYYVQIDDVIIGESWLRTDQNAGIIPSGQSLDIAVTFDASLLELGSYGADLIINSNDPKTPEIVLPASLDVTPPSIVLSTDTLKITAFERLGTDTLFSISNAGGADLTYNVMYVSPAVSVLTGGSGTVVTNGSRQVSFNLSTGALAPGNYIDSLLISSNDPVHPVSRVVLEITVEELIVADMQVEVVCSDNPDKEQKWNIYNPNAFAWNVSWAVNDQNNLADTLLLPGDNFFTFSLANAPRPQRLQLRWLDENDQIQEITTQINRKPCKVIDLKLIPVCSDNPDVSMRWSVQNPNAFGVEVNWQVAGTPNSGSLESAGGTVTIFSTSTLLTSDTIVVKWQDENGHEKKKELTGHTDAKPCKVADLSLVSACSDDSEDGSIKWSVQNPNAFRVTVTWQEAGTSQGGSFDAEGGAETFFYISTEPESDTVSITWQDESGHEKKKEKVADEEDCEEERITSIHSSNEDNGDMSVHPNPFNDKVTLQIKTETEGTYNIRIYDQVGQLIIQKEVDVSGGRIGEEIDTEKLFRGAYFMIIESGDGTIRSSHKLLKQ